MAAMACAPPTLKMRVIPHKEAANRMASCTFPFLFGGVQSTISLHPAIDAGTPSMSTVENNGAEPPGMYNPTFSMGLVSRQQVTPLVVSIFTIACFCEL